jgi:hypothetical protein
MINAGSSPSSPTNPYGRGLRIEGKGFRPEGIVGVCGRVCYTRDGKEIVRMKEQFTAVFQQVPEGYIGFVEELPGANTQGDTLEEARTNLQQKKQWGRVLYSYIGTTAGRMPLGSTTGRGTIATS